MFAHIFYSQFSSIKRFEIKRKRKRKRFVHCWSIRLSVRWPFDLFIFVLSKFNYNFEEADGPNEKFMVGGTILMVEIRME